MTDEGRTVYYVCPFCGSADFDEAFIDGNMRHLCLDCNKEFTEPTTNLEFEKKEKE